jgi:ribonuclease HI
MKKFNADHTIVVYTDGASKGNPGIGAWGAIIAKPNGQVTELGQAYQGVTNNQMEMLAVIESLTFLRDTPGEIAIFTDSTYVIQGMTQWIWGWMKNQWKTANGTDVVNQESWQRLYELVKARKNANGISWHYVRGHVGIEGNERADQIASDLALDKSVSFYDGPLQNYGFALYDFPDDTSLPERSDKQKSSKKTAYSYLSYVGGELKIHKTWSECEARVKGRSGAKFKKALSPADEEQIKKDWGI